MKLRHTVNKFLSGLLVAIMAAMVINVLWQVFSRYVLGAPSSFTDELARYLMIWLGVLGAAYMSGQQMHVAIDIIPRRLSSGARRRMQHTVRWVVLLFCFFGLVVGGSRLVYITFVLEQDSPALQLPLAYVYLAIPISGLLVIYYKIDELIRP